MTTSLDIPLSEALLAEEELADLTTARELLVRARAQAEAVAQTERDLLRTAASFCALFETAAVSEVEFVAAAKDPMGPCPISLAGTGAPGVTDFAVAEFAAMMGWGLGRTRDYLGQVIELRHRLPQCWGRVMADEVPAWKARQVAEQTRMYSPLVAQYVDRATARDLHVSSPGKIKDTIEAALLAVDEDSEIKRVTTLGERYVNVGGRAMTNRHLTAVDAVLDLADGKDLQAAIRQAVRDLDLPVGNPQMEGVSRSQALGHIARHYLTGTTSTHNTAPTHTTARTGDPKSGRAARTVNLFVHLNPTTLGGDAAALGLAMLTNGFHIGVDQVQEWCQASNTRVLVRPVIDLNQDQSTDAYRPTEQITEQVRLTHPTCVFPGCTRPSRQCDLDHIDPYDPHGPPGQTATNTLQPLCRTHHRVKTFTRWQVHHDPDGTVRWTSPRGITHTGNQIIT